MSTRAGPVWTVQPDTLRGIPSYTPNVLIHVESAGLEDTNRYYNQRVIINGTDQLSASAARSYRATRLTVSSGVQYHSSFTYDVYGGSANADSLLAYLQTFNTGDILILNTWDEPLNNRGVFQNELATKFLATLQTSPVWEHRCSYQLVAAKNKGVIYEAIKPRYSATGINTTLFMGQP